VDPLEEIGVNKICSLLNRSELKDLIDLFFLQKNGFDIFKNLEKAQIKEGNFDPAMISYLLEKIQVKDIPFHIIKKIDLDSLKNFIRYLQKRFAEIAFPDK